MDIHFDWGYTPLLARRQELITRMEEARQMSTRCAQQLLYLQGAIAALNDTCHALGVELPPPTQPATTTP